MCHMVFTKALDGDYSLKLLHHCWAFDKNRSTTFFWHPVNTWSTLNLLTKANPLGRVAIVKELPVVSWYLGLVALVNIS
jgi:hypothetical protein